ncbi:hypothetical protein GTY66_11050 [Streptomyces sp. SID8356]|nr:MauE/DoxX family redox-associated membrane protein [Streptomyces sp. SID8356]MYT36586.1 hypothetical protein [Streptomyces sp. SID8356]
MSTMVIFCQILMATVYLLSAILKLRELSAFRAHLISTMPGVRPFASFLAAGVVATEIGTALALMVIRPAWIGFSLSVLLLAGFTLYLVAMLRTRRGASCGCVGDGGGPISGVHVTRNILLVMVSGAGALLATGMGDTPAFAFYFSLGPAVIAGALLLYLDEIVSFFKMAT